jgi:hypothetical protein
LGLIRANGAVGMEGVGLGGRSCPMARIITLEGGCPPSGERV